MNEEIPSDRRVQRSRAAVLEAAEALFVEGGLAAVTVDAIVARSGVAKTTIYRHWASREALLVDLFRSFRFELTLPPADLPAPERLRRVLRQFAAALGTPRWQRALPSFLGIGQQATALAEVRPHIDAHQARVLSTVLGDAVASGELPRETDPREALLQLIGPLTVGALMMPDRLTDAFADRLVDLFFASRAPR